MTDTMADTGTKDLVTQAFTCLPAGQAVAVAKSAEMQAAALEAAGQTGFAFVWKAIALSARYSLSRAA